MYLMFSASAIPEPPSAQKWSKILKYVGAESRGWQVRYLLIPNSLKNVASRALLPLLPVSLQLPSFSGTQTRPSAEHPKKRETVSSAHLSVAPGAAGWKAAAAQTGD